MKRNPYNDYMDHGIDRSKMIDLKRTSYLSTTQKNFNEINPFMTIDNGK